MNLLDDPNSAGLLSLGLRLMSTPGKFGTALGQAGLGAMGDIQQMKAQQQAQKTRALQEQMLQMQLEKAQADQKRSAAMQEAAKASFSPGQMLPEGVAGPQLPPQFDVRGFAERMAALGDPSMLMDLQKKAAPIKVGKDDTLLDPMTMKPVFEGKGTPEKEPEAIRALKAIYGENTPDYLQAVRQYGKKMTTHAPAPSATVINAEKPLINSVASNLGKQLDDGLSAARGAAGAIRTAHQLRAAVDSGKLVSGPGATGRVLALQLGQMMGIGGKNGAEVLANTRQAIQAMAQAELDAAQQMKGQGQITEAEREIIRRAAAGRIEDFTAPEIRLLSEVMEKTARFKISGHRRNTENLRNISGGEALLPFYQIPDVPEYEAPGIVDLGDGFKLNK